MLSKVYTVIHCITTIAVLISLAAFLSVATWKIHKLTDSTNPESTISKINVCADRVAALTNPKNPESTIAKINACADEATQAVVKARGTMEYANQALTNVTDITGPMVQDLNNGYSLLRATTRSREPRPAVEPAQEEQQPAVDPVQEKQQPVVDHDQESSQSWGAWFRSNFLPDPDPTYFQ